MLIKIFFENLILIYYEQHEHGFLQKSKWVKISNKVAKITLKIEVILE